MAVENRAVSEHGIGFEVVQRHAGAQIGKALSGFDIVGDPVCVQFVGHFRKRHRQAIAVVAGKKLRGDSDLLKIADRIDPLRPAFRRRQRRQHHGREDGQNRHHHEQSEDAIPTAPNRRNHERDDQEGKEPDEENRAARFAQDLDIEREEFLPGVEQSVGGALGDAHVTAEMGKPE